MTDKISQGIVEKISQAAQQKQKWLDWKYSFLILLPLFYYYPKPLIWLISPLVKPFLGSYRRSHELQLQPDIIVLSDDPHITLHMLKNCHGMDFLKPTQLQSQNVHIIDLGLLPQIQRPQNANTTSLWIEVIINKLSCLGRVHRVVIIKADERVLQGVEILLYKMRLDQSYKMGSYGSNIHILIKNQGKDMYDRKVVQWNSGL